MLRRDDRTICRALWSICTCAQETDQPKDGREMMEKTEFSNDEMLDQKRNLMANWFGAEGVRSSYARGIQFKWFHLKIVKWDVGIEAAISCRLMAFSSQFYRCRRGHRRRPQPFQQSTQTVGDKQRCIVVVFVTASLQNRLCTDLASVAFYRFRIRFCGRHSLISHLIRGEKRFCFLSSAVGPPYRISHTFHAARWQQVPFINSRKPIFLFHFDICRR